MNRLFFFLLVTFINGCTLLKKPAYCTDCAPNSPNLPMPKPEDVRPPSTSPSVPIDQTQPPSVSPNPNRIQIGTLDSSRNGGYAFATGGGFSKARAAIYTAFPNATLVDFPQLTAATVQYKKLLLLHVLFTDTTPFQPLNEFEQQVLFNFVKNGGNVLLLTDHSDFATANASLLTVFGTTASGVIKRQNVIQVLPQNELLNGRAGTVREITQNWAGSYTQVPQEAQKIARNAGGESVVLLDRNVIANGAGKVLMISDASMFVDDEDTGLFAKNQTFFLNCLNKLLED